MSPSQYLVQFGGIVFELGHENHNGLDSERKGFNGSTYVVIIRKNIREGKSCHPRKKLDKIFIA